MLNIPVLLIKSIRFPKSTIIVHNEVKNSFFAVAGIHTPLINLVFFKSSFKSSSSIFLLASFTRLRKVGFNKNRNPDLSWLRVFINFSILPITSSITSLT
eukprot:NODE_348_length_10403_cov_0.608210.p8 type:complete len:100 gc:universal NODE_348_length_10403_cov_0.608210:3146-2847(-)